MKGIDIEIEIVIGIEIEIEIIITEIPTEDLEIEMMKEVIKIETETAEHIPETEIHGKEILGKETLKISQERDHLPEIQKETLVAITLGNICVNDTYLTFINEKKSK
jgi:hypothetical protein